MVKPLLRSIHLSWKDFKYNQQSNRRLPRTDQDIPLPFIVVMLLLVSLFLFVFFNSVFPIVEVGLEDYTLSLVLGSVSYVLVIGFFFSVITAYFSGMVGVTASPGSSVVIAGILLASWLIFTLVNIALPLPLSIPQIKAAEAIVIIISAIVTGIAAIANDNTQDLKVGQLVGATPWKQQVMLILGVLIASLVIPPVMQLLYDVYGIAGVMPREGMDISQSLPAPTAALLAAITEAFFSHQLPWLMLLVGAGVMMFVILASRLFRIHRYLKLSFLGFAIGMYLPMSSSFPLFLGGLIGWLAKRCLLKKHQGSTVYVNQRIQVGTRIACGLVAGSALLDVLLAVPFSIGQSPDVLSLVSSNWDHSYGIILSILSTLFLGRWMIQRVCQSRV
jgi:putative OPT family oligopeptide transporter